MRFTLASGILLLVGACGTSSGGEIVVSAASSLTDAFGAVETAYEDAHPGVDVVVNTAGSRALAEQILQGAPVDVFAPADTAVMDRVTDHVADAVVFATNRPALVVPRGNPGGVTGLADLARDDLLVGLCAEGIPCGDVARAALARAEVTVSPATEEPNVRALLTKVEAGELDAGIVYATDAAAGAVETVPITGAPDLVVRYPIAAVTAAPNPGGAADFVAFVLSDDGRAILDEYGFGSP
ncbi:MAG: molybdate ABC transporter substrate-binding protein [Acidimicrobiia bacterium]|nr:molybdate ABC transporter substrate-binding protein [Acidimicrobiia bacterium]